MKMLLRLPNWVGDTLLAFPALEGLARMPGAELVLAGRELPLSLTWHLTPIGARIQLGTPRGARALISEVRSLRAHRADVALLMTPSFSSALLLWLAGVPERIGWPEQGRGNLLTRRVERPVRGSLHLADEFMHLARRAGAVDFPELPRLPEQAEEARRAGAFLRANLGRGPKRALVALCPGARYGPAKQWPLERFAELVRMLADQGKVDGVLVGAEDERPAGEQILAAAGSDRWVNAMGAGSLLFGAELLRSADAAVCNDSGAMHLAAAVGTPTVALFGPTDPRWTAPLGPGCQIVRVPTACAPCFSRRCGRDDDAVPCMDQITAGEVAERVRDLLREPRPPGAPALFLDRDGTLLELVPYLHKPEEVRLERGVAAALREAQAAGYRLIVVTNQSGIARGRYGSRDLDAVHGTLSLALEQDQVRIDRFYHCPHHPDFGGRCKCRKPEPGMLFQAAMEMRIDLGRSFMIGDTIEDLLAGVGAGCRTILVRTGYGAAAARERAGEVPPGTAIVNDLAEAIQSVVLPTGKPESSGKSSPERS